MEISTLILKSLHFLLPAGFVAIIIHIIIKDKKAEKKKKAILNDPLYIDAELLNVIPGTPSQDGIVNITLKYQYPLPNGEMMVQDNVLTAIETMDLFKFQKGVSIPIICLKSDPRQNMLKMRNVLEVRLENHKRPWQKKKQ
ncbi:hypothetical protein SOJ76_004268 [Cronobacter turicensis]|nr:hypothetical protein [Cronobacter turicensis]